MLVKTCCSRFDVSVEMCKKMFTIMMSNMVQNVIKKLMYLNEIVELQYRGSILQIGNFILFITQSNHTYLVNLVSYFFWKYQKVLIWCTFGPQQPYFYWMEKSSVTIPLNIIFCVPQRKVSHTGWYQLSKWQFSFWG